MKFALCFCFAMASLASFGHGANAASIFASGIVAQSDSYLNSSFEQVTDGSSAIEVLGSPDGQWIQFGSDTETGFVILSFSGFQVVDGPGVDFMLHLVDFAGDTTGTDTFELLVSEDGFAFLSLGTVVPPAAGQPDDVSIDIGNFGLDSVLLVRVQNPLPGRDRNGPEVDALEAINFEPISIAEPPYLSLAVVLSLISVGLFLRPSR